MEHTLWIKELRGQTLTKNLRNTQRAYYAPCSTLVLGLYRRVLGIYNQELLSAARTHKSLSNFTMFEQGVSTLHKYILLLKSLSTLLCLLKAKAYY